MPKTKKNKIQQKKFDLILNKNVEKLATLFERVEFQDYLNLLNNPKRLLWVNFLAGLSRGVGILLGGGVVGALTIGLLIAFGVWMVHTLGMPWILAKFHKWIQYANDFIQHK